MSWKSLLFLWYILAVLAEKGLKGDTQAAILCMAPAGSRMPGKELLLFAGHRRSAQTSDKHVDEPVETCVQIHWHPETARYFQ